MKPSERQWLEDYHDFLNTEEVPVPPELSNRVLTLIKRRMRPSVLNCSCFTFPLAFSHFLFVTNLV